MNDEVKEKKYMSKGNFVDKVKSKLNMHKIKSVLIHVIVLLGIFVFIVYLYFFLTRTK